METIHSAAEFQNKIIRLRESGKRIGFVPTMGALHDGHMSLVRAARSQCDILVLSIFVNPLQFAPTEDLEKYPRTLEADSKLAEKEGVDLIFAPSPRDMYPEGYDSNVSCGGITERLEGTSRPGHFDGVTTVVLKLFNIVQPHFAVFGQKDAQQSLVIRRMVRDLNIPVDIIVSPTVRESDGLAMSSRNQYLTAAERSVVPAIYRGLISAKELFEEGEKDSTVLRATVENIYNAEELLKIEYIALTNANCLPIESVKEEEVLLSVVCRTEESNTRLIDNVILQ